MPTIPEIIKKKRDKHELQTDEINFFIKSAVDGTASDSQIGAWLMAIFLNGMNDKETVDVTDAMLNTGERLQWEPSWTKLLVDKHSTGGVGDKVSLILAPALAACGLKIPMISGRGLAFTGGTLDKLESIPGYKVSLTLEEMKICLNDVGCCIVGQTNSIAPGDRILYKHRDVTNTVDCIPLIVSSILSKKAAGGASALVMDIKVGNGTFLKNEEIATELTNKLIEVSKILNIETRAVLSRMDIPLGCCVGNALEIIESVECLSDRGPKDVLELVTVQGGLLLQTKGFVKSVKEGEKKIENCIRNGSALEKFKNMLMCQGVSKETAEEICSGNFYKVLPKSRFTTTLIASKSGFITDMRAIDVGMACWHLGAGRSKADEPIDSGIGVKLLKVVGDEIKQGDAWIEVHHNSQAIPEKIQLLLERSITIDDVPTRMLNKSRIIKLI